LYTFSDILLADIIMQPVLLVPEIYHYKNHKSIAVWQLLYN